MNVCDEEKVRAKLFEWAQEDCFSSERADRIRRRAAAGSSTTLDASELSENSNTSFTTNDESTHPIDTSDVHQKGKLWIDLWSISSHLCSFSINDAQNQWE